MRRCIPVVELERYDLLVIQGGRERAISALFSVEFTSKLLPYSEILKEILRTEFEKWRLYLDQDA